MATDCKGFSQATRCLKIGTFVLLIAVSLHIVGFSTANWSFISLKHDENLSVPWMMPRENHEGLWSICECIVLNFKICSCFGRHEEPGWFCFLQGTQTVGLIGLLISGILSLIQVYSSQNRRLKQVNVFVIILAGASIGVGLVMYAIHLPIDLKLISKLFDQDIFDLKGHFGYSYYLCIAADLICLLVCPILFVKDIQTVVLPKPQLSVLYDIAGNVIFPQGQMVNGGGINGSVGFVPPIMSYAASPFDDSPPAYCPDLPSYSLKNDAVPPKE